MAQPCSGNPCQHGTCEYFGDVRYQCTCHAGYTGTNCDTDISKLTPYHAESCYELQHEIYNNVASTSVDPGEPMQPPVKLRSSKDVQSVALEP